MKIRQLALPIILATATAAYADSKLLVTAGGVGSFSSTVAGVNTESFSGLSKGVYNNLSWGGVGTIDKVSLIPNDQYGGTTASTQYSVQSTDGLGGNAAVPKSTLTLNSPATYFGLYWSAGDGNNVLDFYNGANQVAHFTTANLLSYLPSSYNGNPNAANKGQDAGEKFAFLNFYAGSGTTFDKVVFSNLSSSGFESQNWTVRSAAYNPLTDGVIAGTPLAAVTTTSGVSTVSQIVNINYDGTTVTSASSTGAKTPFLTQGGGGNFISYGFSANGTSLGVVHSPEPSVYLTFLMMSLLLVLATRRKRTEVLE